MSSITRPDLPRPARPMAVDQGETSPSVAVSAFLGEDADEDACSRPADGRRTGVTDNRRGGMCVGVIGLDNVIELAEAWLCCVFGPGMLALLFEYGEVVIGGKVVPIDICGACVETEVRPEISSDMLLCRRWCFDCSAPIDLVG